MKNMFLKSVLVMSISSMASAYQASSEGSCEQEIIKNVLRNKKVIATVLQTEGKQRISDVRLKAVAAQDMQKEDIKGHGMWYVTLEGEQFMYSVNLSRTNEQSCSIERINKSDISVFVKPAADEGGAGGSGY